MSENKQKTIETEPSWQSSPTTISWLQHFDTKATKRKITACGLSHLQSDKLEQKIKKKTSKRKTIRWTPTTDKSLTKARQLIPRLCLRWSERDSALPRGLRCCRQLFPTDPTSTATSNWTSTGLDKRRDARPVFLSLSLFRIFLPCEEKNKCSQREATFLQTATRRGRQTLSTTVAHQQASLTRPLLNLSYACWHKSERRSKQFDSTSKPVVWKTINMTKVHLLSR